jgi:hypothetical protein
VTSDSRRRHARRAERDDERDCIIHGKITEINGKKGRGEGSKGAVSAVSCQIKSV